MKHKLPEELAKWYDEEYCLDAVKNNGYELKYIKIQTPEICLEAVKNYAWALKYIKIQTPEICLAAVKQVGNSLQYVKDQTPEICLAALEDYPNAIKSIDLDVLTEEEFEYIKLRYLSWNINSQKNWLNGTMKLIV